MNLQTIADYVNNSTFMSGYLDDGKDYIHLCHDWTDTDDNFHSFDGRLYLRPSNEFGINWLLGRHTKITQIEELPRVLEELLESGHENLFLYYGDNHD